MNVEDRTQAAIVEYARTVAPHIITFSVPNGAFLAGATEAERGRRAAKLKWTGLLPGVFDLMLLGPDGFRAAIEVKAPGGVLSAHQQEMRDRYLDIGLPHCVARGIDDVREAFAAWRLQTREAA